MVSSPLLLPSFPHHASHHSCSLYEFRTHEQLHLSLQVTSGLNELGCESYLTEYIVSKEYQLPNLAGPEGRNPIIEVLGSDTV
eukprot:3398179-Ditylum_brightwellii.AAC.1